MRLLSLPILIVLALGARDQETHGQSRSLLGTDGANRILLERDSVKFDGDLVEFLALRVDSEGRVARRRFHQIDCEVAKARTRFTTRWTLWLTVTDPVEAAAFKELCAPVAGRWTFMFPALNGEYLVDRATVDTIPRLRSGRRVWLKLVHDTAEAVVGKTQKAHHQMVRYDIDCVAKRFRTLAHFKYDKDGRVIDSYDTEPDAASWSSVIPESNGEGIADWICQTLPIVDRLLPVRKR